VPERYGTWPTCYDWFVHGRRDMTGDRLLAHAQTKSDAVGAIVWEVSIDSTTVRSHQHAADGGRKRGASASPDEGLRRGWGGLATKLHPVCDGQGRPLSVVVTAGHRHESTHLEPVLDAIRAPRVGGRVCLRKRPDRLITDNGYSYERCRRLLRRRGIPHTIPERDDQRVRRARRPGRQPTFDKATYRWRNRAERCVNRLNQRRAVVTRYQKRLANDRMTVVIAALMIWLGA